VRVRTRRFVARMQADTNVLQDSISPHLPGTHSTTHAGLRTSWKDATGLCRCRRMGEHRGTTSLTTSVCEAEFSTSSTSFRFRIGRQVGLASPTQGADLRQQLVQQRRFWPDGGGLSASPQLFRRRATRLFRRRLEVELDASREMVPPTSSPF